MKLMTTQEHYLRAYDQQLRTDAETPSAKEVTRMGPLWLVTFDGGRGFTTYRHLGGVPAPAIPALVVDALDYFRSIPEITDVEWKTRGHDTAPGLHEAQLSAGFTPGDTESIMVGPLTALCRDVAVPDGVRLRTVTSGADVRAMSAMADEAFGEPASQRNADALIARLARNDGMELWVAEIDGMMVCAGRLEPVPGTKFASIWGGATLKGHRGRGIYRALTAARAGSALAMGKTLVHSDSTEFSRSILERSGLVRVSSTTPYNWKR